MIHDHNSILRWWQESKFTSTTIHNNISWSFHPNTYGNLLFELSPRNQTFASERRSAHPHRRVYMVWFQQITIEWEKSCDAPCQGKWLFHVPAWREHPPVAHCCTWMLKQNSRCSSYGSYFPEPSTPSFLQQSIHRKLSKHRIWWNKSFWVPLFFKTVEKVNYDQLDLTRILRRCFENSPRIS